MLLSGCNSVRYRPGPHITIRASPARNSATIFQHFWGIRKFGSACILKLVCNTHTFSNKKCGTSQYPDFIYMRTLVTVVLSVQC